jgi:hypothetical protein
LSSFDGREGNRDVPENDGSKRKEKEKIPNY